MWPQSVLGWWCFAPTLGESLCSFHPSWAFNASGGQQWVKRLPNCQSQAGEEPGDLQPVRGGPWDPPLIHKTCHAKSFHAPASARWSRKVHLFISLRKCLWREIISRRKQILWWDIALCEISISVEASTMGMVFGLNVVCLRELGGNLTLQKSQSKEILPPGCLPIRLGWKRDLQWRFWD